jgi:hypothetical protein
MSEVLGSADPDDIPVRKADRADIRGASGASDISGTSDASDIDDDSDDDFDDDFADLDASGYPIPGTGFLSTIASSLTLAITSLVLAVVSLIGLLSTYLLTSAITAAHTSSDTLFGQKVTTALELGLGVIAGILAVIAHSAGAHDADAAKHRTARAMAGAAFLLSVLSVAQSISALFLLAGAHPGTTVGG